MSEGAWTMRAMTEIEWLDGRVTKVPESAPNYDFVVNTDLITQAMPVLGGSAAFAAEVGAENELLVPFMMQNTNDYFEGYETVRFEKAFPGTYTMKMTDLPERRLFRFEVK